MAKVKNPFLSSEARGSVGGMTASRNTMGAYMRAKASPVQPRSESQQKRRYALQKLTREYQDLSSVQIGNWNDFASNWPITDVFGDSISITGLDWYVSLNSRLAALGVASNLIPPLNPNTTFNTTVSIFQNVSTGNIMMSLTGSLIPGSAIWMSYSSNLPKSSIFTKKSCKLRTIYDSSVSLAESLIAYNLLSPDDSVVQFKFIGVDPEGRATPVQKKNIFPATTP
jgi:hypothetical protein